MDMENNEIKFASVEQAFQYSKTFFSKAREDVLGPIRQEILSTTNGLSLRAQGRSIHGLDVAAWNAAKFDIMKDLIRESFLQNPQLGKNFVSKTDGYILTHNQDNSEWGELFPKALMEVRDELKRLYKEQSIDDRFEPRVFVTYYGSKHIPAEAFRVQIYTSAPESMKDDIDVRFETLFPSFKTMVEPHKEGTIDDAEYARRYNESVLEKEKDKILTNVNKIIDMAREEHKDVYLFCYCRPGAFCHRYLVNNFLNENGITCQEVPEDRMMYQKGHVALFGEEEYPSNVQLPGEEKISAPSSVSCSQDVDIVFTQSDGSYVRRTYENAQADDVDFTFAFAANFDTYGEKATAKSAGDSLVRVELPMKPRGGIDLSNKGVSRAVSQIVNQLPEEFLQGEPFGVNIAGNGIYTMKDFKVTQDDADKFLCLVGAGLRQMGVRIMSIRTGGQTGMDEAGAVMGKVLDIPTTVHGPKNFLFRDVNGRDIKDEQAYKDRFMQKDYAALRAVVEKALKPAERKYSKIRQNTKL